MGCAAPLGAQSSVPAPIPVTGVGHPRVGLVLSGGSAKAFAHIGVLQVLQQMGIHVDIVTGTSMGAIIGALYAAGYTPDQLDTLVTREDWGSLFHRPTDRRQQSPAEKAANERYMITFPLEHARIALPQGVIPRQAIAERLERYLWPVHDISDFNNLPTAFGALVTDLNTGVPSLLQHGSLAQAVEGSAAVPGAFAPVRLADGRQVVDGAVVRNLPAEDARDMGADLLICVDVSERPSPVDSLHSLVDVVQQTVAFRVQASNRIERPYCDVIVDPKVTGVPSTDFSRGQFWIDRGRRAAEAVRPALEALAREQQAGRGDIPPRPPLPADDSIWLKQVSWTPVSEGAEALVRARVGLKVDSWVTRDQVSAAVARIYSTGRFDQVSYRVEPAAGGRALIFDLTEGDRNVVGVGVRYDTPRGASLIAGATVNDWLTPGSKATLTARLGDEQQYEGRFMLGAGPEARFLQTYRATLSRTSLPHVRPAGVGSAPVLDVHELAAQIARVIGNAGYAGLEITRGRAIDGVPGTNGVLAMRSQSYTTLGAVLSLDTYDRVFAPSQGMAVLLESRHTVGGGPSWEHHLLNAEGAVPVHSGVSVLGRVELGAASGAQLPLHERFFLGGSVPSSVWTSSFVPFPGIDPQSAQGTVVQVAQAGVQAEVRDNLILGVRGNVGNVFDGWPPAAGARRYLRGVGITLGTTLAPGPLSITFGTRSLHTAPVIEILFGATF